MEIVEEGVVGEMMVVVFAEGIACMRCTGVLGVVRFRVGRLRVLSALDVGVVMEIFF